LRYMKEMFGTAKGGKRGGGVVFFFFGVVVFVVGGSFRKPCKIRNKGTGTIGHAGIDRRKLKTGARTKKEVTQKTKKKVLPLSVIGKKKTKTHFKGGGGEGEAAEERRNQTFQL